jgi:uncharacterized C2H2 Zn-finger protein
MRGCFASCVLNEPSDFPPIYRNKLQEAKAMQETIREELNGSKARYEKGLELYKEGKVFFSKGMYKVNGYEVDLRSPVKCECPDFKVRKHSCKHIFAAELFSKNRGKEKIEHLNEHSNGSNDNGANSKIEHKHTPNKPQEAHNKDFTRQSTIINTPCSYKLSH